MKKLWNAFSSINGFKGKVVTIGTMLLAFWVAGIGLMKLVTHEQVEAEIIKVEALCDVKCDKAATTTLNSALSGQACAQVASEIKQRGLEDCAPRERDYYSLRFSGADGVASEQRLSSKEFSESYAVGDAVSILRNPDTPNEVEPPVGWITYAALAYGLILLALNILWPFIRKRKARAV